jgi:hypothetical protein
MDESKREMQNKTTDNKKNNRVARTRGEFKKVPEVGQKRTHVGLQGSSKASKASKARVALSLLSGCGVRLPSSKKAKGSIDLAQQTCVACIFSTESPLILRQRPLLPRKPFHTATICAICAIAYAKIAKIGKVPPIATTSASIILASGIAHGCSNGQRKLTCNAAPSPLKRS